ncbi:MAG: hypothetical protein V3V49_10890 [Candidatus Krumholzibacteria bacterium]
MPRVAIVLAMLLVCTPISTISATVVEPGEGQIVVAFNPQLTGDPAQDFTREVGQGEAFTIYVISGSLPERVTGYRFGFQFSEAAAVVLTEVRSPGDVAAWQNSIGNFVAAEVTFPAACFDITSGMVIGEVDLELTREAGTMTVRVMGWNGPLEKPDYKTCGGVRVDYDDSASAVLSITPPAQVPVENVSWGLVKFLFSRSFVR